MAAPKAVLVELHEALAQLMLNELRLVFAGFGTITSFSGKVRII